MVKKGGLYSGFHWDSPTILHQVGSEPQRGGEWRPLWAPLFSVYVAGGQTGDHLFNLIPVQALCCADL